MELWGVEPQASWMQIKRSTNWATTPVIIRFPVALNLPIWGYPMTDLSSLISIIEIIDMSLTAILKKIDKVNEKHRNIQLRYNSASR